MVCTVYLLGVTICFLLSTTFHTLLSHSASAYRLGMQLDIQGVLVLMWGATVPLVYYAFPCGEDEGLRWGYWGLFTVLAGACSIVTFSPSLRGPELGPYRAVLFGGFGGGSFAGLVVHGVLRFGWEEMSRRVGLGWIAGTVVLNGMGVGVYAAKVSLMISFSFFFSFSSSS